VTGTVHGTTVAVREAGLLIRGRAGAGKTTLALCLIDQVRARGGFARLVADDRTALTVAGGRLIASAPEAIAGCVEMRGLGIAPAATLPAVRLTHIVDLVPPHDVPRMPEESAAQARVCGVALMRLALAQRSTTSAVLTLITLVERQGLTACVRR
jgi:serine kinase of HPr protein (carbohydrate metabolism regulator)